MYGELNHTPTSIYANTDEAYLRGVEDGCQIIVSNIQKNEDITIEILLKRLYTNREMLNAAKIQRLSRRIEKTRETGNVQYLNLDEFYLRGLEDANIWFIHEAEGGDYPSIKELHANRVSGLKLMVQGRSVRMQKRYELAFTVPENLSS